MNMIDKAMRLALKAHFGQANSHDGEPYVLHLFRVWVAVREAGGTDAAQAVAWLHDILEDTDMTYTQLVEEFEHHNKNIAPAVFALTKQPGEANEDYYNRVKATPLAGYVKLHDIHDNFGRNHLIADETTRLRMAKKYSLGIDILTRSNG